MSLETIFTNAVLVLPGTTMPGTLTVHGDEIISIDPGRSAAPGAIDLDGDYLIPGAVDVHTDNLERQVLPRSLARWPSRSAMIAHDAQCAAAGVTTILDALCLGDLGFDTGRIQTFWDGVADLDALTPTGLLKSEHYLHLRCEVPALDTLACFDAVADHPLVRTILLAFPGARIDTVHDAAGRVVSEIPGARRVDWPDAGHLPSLERPADFLNLLREWTTAEVV